MTSFRVAFLAALCSIFLASCGDTFRPIAVPDPGVQPTPQASKTAQVVTGTGVGTVTNYNLSGGTLTGQANLGQGPSAAVLAGSREYVANQTDNTLSAFFPLSPQNPVPSTVTLSANASPVAMATPPNASVLYVAYPNLDAVGIVSPVSNIEVGVIPLNANGFSGSGPSVMLTDAAGTKLVVGNTGSNNISIIDLGTSAVVGTIGGCSHPIAMARTPDVPYVYVVCRDSNNVMIVNVNTKVADYNFPVAAAPVSATFDNVRKRLIVPSSTGNVVTFFEENFSLPLASQHVTTVVPIGASATGAAPLPDGSKTYISTLNGIVVVIDSGNLTVRTNITAPGQGQFIAASTDSTRVAVAATGPDALEVIDTSTESVVANHALLGPAKALLIF